MLSWLPLLLAACDGEAHDSGPAAVLPECETAATFVTWTRDQGATLAPTTSGPEVNNYTFGIAIDPDDAHRMWAEHAGILWSSQDAGCTWSGLGDLPTTGWVLQAAPRVLWGYSVNEGQILRLDDAGIQTWEREDSFLGMGVDPLDPDHLRLGGKNDLTDTRDGGQSWSTVQGPGPTAYTWAFDQTDLDRVAAGSMSEGAWLSRDGGQSWAAATGLGDKTNIFTLRWSPADADVVWAEGLDIDEADAGADNQGRHVWRSEDGGGTFQSVVEQGGEIVLTNGVTASADPFDRDAFSFVFGSSFGGIGTYLYRYDHGEGRTSWEQNAWDEVSAMEFSPVTPGLLYLAVVDEVID